MQSYDIPFPQFLSTIISNTIIVQCHNQQIDNNTNHWPYSVFISFACTCVFKCVCVCNSMKFYHMYELYLLPQSKREQRFHYKNSCCYPHLSPSLPIFLPKNHSSVLHLYHVVILRTFYKCNYSVYMILTLAVFH